jgi:hypothetical protein
MDSGMERSGYYSIEEAIEDGIAPVPLSLDKTLDIQRTLDVIDHLFSCEVLHCNLASHVFGCLIYLNYFIGMLYFSGNMAQGSHSSTNRLHMYLPCQN